MHKNLFISTVTIILLTLVPLSLQAQTDSKYNPRCLEQAERKIKPNSLITIVRTDTSKIQGRLVSVNFSQSLLTLTPVSDTNATPASYLISDIAKIQYRAPGKTNAGWVVLGLLGGALIGGFIGAGIDPGGGGSGPGAIDFGGGPAGVAIGAGGGLLLGILLPMALPSTWTIKCK